jgi:putative DNA primase/helicase
MSARNATGAGISGRALAIADAEPAVDGAALLDELAGTIRRHVVLDAAAADAVALWIVHTHAIDAAQISPRLAITSPEKRCGKMTLLMLLSGLVARPALAACISRSALFRTIDSDHPTLLIDEADSMPGGPDSLRNILNAGYWRPMAKMRISESDGRNGWSPREFDLWGAVAIAAIGSLPGTVEDRAIKVALRRRRRDETVERLRLDRLDVLAPLAHQVARWAAYSVKVLRVADPEIPAELHDYAADNWRPLFAIADEAGGEWPERARAAAVALVCDGAEAADGEAFGIVLLGDFREIFERTGRAVLTTSEILAELKTRDDRPGWEGDHAAADGDVAQALRHTDEPHHAYRQRDAAGWRAGERHGEGLSKGGLRRRLRAVFVPSTTFSRKIGHTVTS